MSEMERNKEEEWQGAFNLYSCRTGGIPGYLPINDVKTESDRGWE